MGVSVSPGGHAGVAGAGAALADGAGGWPEAAGGCAAQGDDGAHHEADLGLDSEMETSWWLITTTSTTKSII